MKKLVALAALTFAGCMPAVAARTTSDLHLASPAPVAAVSTPTPTLTPERTAAVASAAVAPTPKATPKPAAAPKLSTPAPVVAKATPKPTVKPKAATPKPTATPIVPAVEPHPPVFDILATCDEIVVNAGVPAWILIYATPDGAVLPTEAQEVIIDAMAPTGVQSVTLPGGRYTYDVSITYFDTVEDAHGTNDCPA